MATLPLNQNHQLWLLYEPTASPIMSVLLNPSLTAAMSVLHATPPRAFAGEGAKPL